MTRLFVFTLTLTLLSCTNNDAVRVETPITKPVQNITPTKDQQDRRVRSEEFCKSKNIPVYKNPNSLFVEPEEKVTIRTKDEVVDRAIALCYLELKSEKSDPKMLADFDKKYNAMAKLTTTEKADLLAFLRVL